MRVGTVFFWNRYQRHPTADPKGRWFIYFGKTVYGLQPLLYHIGTTTTQLHYYRNDGIRKNNIIVQFTAKECGFESDCILDIDRDIFSDNANRIEGNSEIHIKGQIPDAKLRDIYLLISKSRNVAKMVKRDIFFCFRSDGIKNLPKP